MSSRTLTILLTFSALAITSGCVKKESPGIPTPKISPTQIGSDVDREAARKVSDLMVDDFISDRRRALRSRMETGFQDYYDEQAFENVFDQIIETYGKPLKAQYNSTRADVNRRLVTTNLNESFGMPPKPQSMNKGKFSSQLK
jgi:hypothetical protein